MVTTRLPFSNPLYPLQLSSPILVLWQRRLLPILNPLSHIQRPQKPRRAVIRARTQRDLSNFSVTESTPLHSPKNFIWHLEFLGYVINVIDHRHVFLLESANPSLGVSGLWRRSEDILDRRRGNLGVGRGEQEVMMSGPSKPSPVQSDGAGDRDLTNGVWEGVGGLAADCAEKGVPIGLPVSIEILISSFDPR